MLHCRNPRYSRVRFLRTASLAAVPLFSLAPLFSWRSCVRSYSNNRNNARSDTCITSMSDSISDGTHHPHPSEFPIGLGTMDINQDEISNAIISALRLGYRRLDCAPVYFNEDKIGDTLSELLGKPLMGGEETESSNTEKANTILREDLFVVSKLASPFHRREHVKIGLRKTLNDLRLDYLDLYLVHWPQAFKFVDIDPDVRGYDGEAQYIDDSNNGANIDPNVSIHETWTAMEELVEEGLVKHIGVSNFPVSLLHELMAGNHKIPPAVNQVELHPYLQQSKLLAYCQKRKVHVQAYSPLGTAGYKEEKEPTLLEDTTLQRIAAKHQMTVAQLCLVWAQQRGTSVVVKSASPKRQKENWESLSSGTTGGNATILSEEELTEIEKLERGHRFFRPEEWWGDMAMAVFD